MQPNGKPTVMVVGELNVDLILEQVSALPELDKERVAKGMTLTLGSSSAILAANGAALGVSVSFVGLVGADTFGRYCVDRLQKRGVDTRFIEEREDLATGLTAIYTFGGRRGAMTYPGAMAHLTINDIPDEFMRNCRHLHLSSYYLQTGIRTDCSKLFRTAREMGLSTSFDTNWDPDEQWGDDVLAVLDHVDVFLPNEDEARLISGEDDLDRAMERLAERAGTVVVTCGAKGVRARSGDQSVSLPGVAVEPVDAVGAGDSFNAGFLSRYIKGADLETCLRFGLMTGAFSTLSAGGISAFDDPEKFAMFVRDVGVEVGT